MNNPLATRWQPSAKGIVIHYFKVSARNADNARDLIYKEMDKAECYRTLNRWIEAGQVVEPVKAEVGNELNI